MEYQTHVNDYRILETIYSRNYEIEDTFILVVTPRGIISGNELWN